MVWQEENLLIFFSDLLTRSFFFISVDIFSPVHFAY